MNKYKVVIGENFRIEYVNATRIEFESGFVLFYDNAELICTVNNPISVIKKPQDAENI